MIDLIKLPAKVIGILEANVTPGEIALGVCLGMFLGFIPLNSTAALLLSLFFFVFKINRMSTLLSLPVFKTLYIMGVNKFGDSIGSYFLERADYLTGFWRFVTNLPVIAYLDINRTTVAGGIIISSILSVPIYLVTKKTSATLLKKYSAKMRDSSFSKWVKTVYHVSSLSGPDAAAVMNNVKEKAKQTLFARIKSYIIKPGPSGDRSWIGKRVKPAGVAIVAVSLVLIQFGVGLVISPAVGSMVMNAVNRGGAKVTADKINIWPLTLSFSMRGLKVFNPGSPDKRIAASNAVSARISPVALLSKRLVFSEINMKGFEFDLEGSPDGSFNIQRLVVSDAGPSKAKDAIDSDGLWRRAYEKKDIFARAYSVIKNDFSKTGYEKRTSARKITRIAQDLPQGRLVEFKTPADTYLFEVRNLNIEGRVNITPGDAGPIELRNTGINLRRVAVDPQNGFRLDGIKMRSELFKDNAAEGRFDFVFSRGLMNADQTAVCRLELIEVDLDSVRFVYEDSLPVCIDNGKISMVSNSKIIGESISSDNSIMLTGQRFRPKQGGAIAVGFVPIAAACEALNSIDPIRLKFEIKGTFDRPEFAGFQETLLGLMKPYIADIGERLKTRGLNELGKFLKKNIEKIS